MSNRIKEKPDDLLQFIVYGGNKSNYYLQPEAEQPQPSKRKGSSMDAKSTPEAGDDSNEEYNEKDLTARALMVLVVDLSLLEKNVQRLKIQVHALCKRNPVEPGSGPGQK